MVCMQEAQEKLKEAMRQIQYDYKPFGTTALQRFGLARVTIRSKVTGLVVAKIYSATGGNIFLSYDEDSPSAFYAVSDEHVRLGRRINEAIRQRAIELAISQVNDTCELKTSYDVIVDLDERLEQLLEQAFQDP